MEITTFLETLKDFHAVVVGGYTFEPRFIDELSLEGGETILWIRDGADRWLSVDEFNDEVMLFQDLDEEIDVAEEALMYAGKDYEFSSEGAGKLRELDTEENDEVIFKDFEADGDVVRMIESQITTERKFAIGTVVPVDELQLA